MLCPIREARICFIDIYILISPINISIGAHLSRSLTSKCRQLIRLALIRSYNYGDRQN